METRAWTSILCGKSYRVGIRPGLGRPPDFWHAHEPGTEVLQQHDPLRYPKNSVFFRLEPARWERKNCIPSLFFTCLCRSDLPVLEKKGRRAWRAGLFV